MTRDRETEVLLAAMSAGIKSPKELANFMAQVTHESSDLKHLEEGFRYTKSISQIPVKSALHEGPKALEAARLEALRGNPERLADLMYGGRMGNSEPGDGFKYRGRGYIQLTGKDGYRQAGDALGLDLVNHPDLAADPGNAAKIAAWYWVKNVHRVAPENVVKATHVINNGENGLKDRKARFAQWEQKLTPEFVAQLAQGETRLTELAEKHPESKAVPVLNEPAHADHALFMQAQSGVHQLDAKVGRTPDQRSDNLAAALVVAARNDGMSCIDHVLLGTDASRVFAVQGALSSPFKQIASVLTVESLNTPVAQSTLAWDQAIQQATSQSREQQAPQPTHQTPHPALAI